MRKWLLLLSFAIALPKVAARAEDCLQTHLRDAIRLNTARLPGYSRLTSGKSVGISKLLIGLEQVSLPFAKVFDGQAKRFHAYGSPVLCDDLVSMSTVAPFQDHAAPTTPPPALLQTWKPWETTFHLLSALNERGYVNLEAETKTALDALSPFPSYFCMTRHILDSVLRTSHLAPLREAREATELGIPTDYWGKPVTSRSLTYSYLVSQILTIPTTHAMDQSAAPFQASGVAIICQDVPYIPWK